jgi:hypothetical protein
MFGQTRNPKLEIRNTSRQGGNQNLIGIFT